MKLTRIVAVAKDTFDISFEFDTANVQDVRFHTNMDAADVATVLRQLARRIEAQAELVKLDEAPR